MRTVVVGSMPREPNARHGATGVTAKRSTGIMSLVAALVVMVSAAMAWPALAADRDVGGLWTKTTHPDPGNLAIVYIDRQVAKVVGYGQISGRPALWYAEGTFEGGRLRLVYRYSANMVPLGWDPQGTMHLELSTDGNRLVGKAQSSSGSWSGEIAFKRIGLPPE